MKLRPFSRALFEARDARGVLRDNDRVVYGEVEIQHEAFLGLSPECRESHAFFRRLLRASGARAGPYDSQLSRVLDFHDR